MRLFLSSYRGRHNFEITKRFQVFGAKSNQNAAQVSRLRMGDLIILRNSAVPFQCSLLGGAFVVGAVFDQTGGVQTSPYRDFLWPDEEQAQRIIYSLRIPVRFAGALTLPPDIDWPRLCQLGIRGERRRPMRDKNQLTSFFRGNYITDREQIEGFFSVLGIPVPSSSWNCEKVGEADA